MRRHLSNALALIGALVVASSDAAHASDPAPGSKDVAAVPGTVKGALLGKPFEVRSAVSGYVWGTGGGVAVVILSDQPESCDLRGVKRQKKGARRIHLLLSYKSEGSTMPPEHKDSFVVGDYRRFDYSDAFIVSHDENCKEVRRVEVNKGEVQLLRYPRPQRPQEYAGTFKLVVGKERIEGSFTAPLCDAVSQGVDKVPDFSEPACE